jgi:class 3 adenylate cyclase
MDKLKQSKKVVVFIDICNSTLIVEEMIESLSFDAWVRILRSLKNRLRNKRDELGFELYKFLGDGWILLFDMKTDPQDILNVCKEISQYYKVLCNRINTENKSETLSRKTGLSFGLAHGTLVEIIMDSRKEYVGRALNLAARLQSAIKDKDKNYQNKMLITSDYYMKHKMVIDSIFVVKKVTRELRNFGKEPIVMYKLELI